MDFTIDELFYLLGRRTAEVERLASINQLQAEEIRRLRSEGDEPPLRSNVTSFPDDTPEE